MIEGRDTSGGPSGRKCVLKGPTWTCQSVLQSSDMWHQEIEGITDQWRPCISDISYETLRILGKNERTNVIKRGDEVVRIVSLSRTPRLTDNSISLFAAAAAALFTRKKAVRGIGEDWKTQVPIIVVP